MIQTFTHFDFISKEEQLMLGLATYLAEQNRYVTVKELTEYFSVSSQKLRPILKNLEDALILFDQSGFYLDISKKQGAFFSIADDHNLKEFTSFVILQSPLVKIFIAICFRQFVSVTKYSQDSFFSESTVRRSLNRIRQIIKPYNLKITRSNYDLDGSETQIRYFLFLFFWRIYRGTNWPFEFVSEIQVEKMSIEFSKTGIIELLTPIEKSRFKFFLAIGQLRRSQGNFIEENILNLDEVSPLEEAFIASSPSFSNIHFSFFEKRFIFHFSKGLNWLKDLSQQYLFEEASNSLEYQGTVAFINQFQKELFLIPTSRINELQLFSFRIHTVALLFENFSSDMNGFRYDNYFDSYYPVLTKKLIKIISTLTETNPEIFKEKNFLLIHYLMLVASLDKITYFEKPINIVYDTTLGNLLQEIQIERMYNYFKDFFNLEIFVPQKVSDDKKINFVLTSVPLSEYKLIYSNAEILTISRKLKMSDLMKLTDRFLMFIKK